MKKYPLFAALIVILILSACGNKREEMPSGTDSVSTEAMEQTETALSLQIEPVTIEGYYYPTSEPIRVNIGVERVLQGEEAYQELLTQNVQCPPLDDGQEYILVTVNMKYEDGEADSIELYEERHASLGAARVLFNIPNKASNSVDVTSYLANPIWGQDPIVGRTVAKGESISGDIAFLVEQGNTQPLYFWGYNQSVQFQIH